MALDVVNRVSACPCEPLCHWELGRTMEFMTQRSSTSAIPLTRAWAALWLLAVPVLAVTLLWWVSQPPTTFEAEVVGSSVSRADGGLVGDVRWVDDNGVRRVRSFDLTEEHVTSGTVMLVSMEGEVTVLDSSESTGASGLTMAVTALIAFLFAVVVLATVRGFGFVRGTGQPGEMTPDEVEESRGFYWRH